jgi:hypothetical protein
MPAAKGSARTPLGPKSQNTDWQRNIIDGTRREHDLTIQKLKEENELELEKGIQLIKYT